MAGQPVDISYRAIGSSSGKAEFLAKDSAFGCAEIPVLESAKAERAASCCRSASDGVRTSEKTASSRARASRVIDHRGTVSFARFW